MAKMLVRLRLTSGNGVALERALENDAAWTEAKSKGLRFKQVYVNPADKSDATIISGWRSPEEAETFRREHLTGESISNAEVEAAVIGEAAVVIAVGVKG